MGTPGLFLPGENGHCQGASGALDAKNQGVPLSVSFYSLHVRVNLAGVRVNCTSN